MVTHLLLYVASFVAIWYGAGLIISSTSTFSKKLRVSPFAFSFVFLGLLTSTPELSVGLQSIASHNPEIFIGNLLGGIVVLFLIVIPLLAIFGNGISLKNELDNKSLFATLLVIAAPSVFILDKKITTIEGAVMVFLYIALLFLVERKKGIFDKNNSELLNRKAYLYKDVLKIFLGIGIVFISSSIIVEKTILFSDMLYISAFYVSLIVVSLGTNLPELSLAIRSVISGKRDIAMGDYIGSAAANTLLFGILALLNDGEALTVSDFLITFIFIAVALSAFFIFSSTKNYISRRAGFMLFGIYILFVIIQLAK